MAEKIKSMHLEFSSNLSKLDGEVKGLSKSVSMSQRKLASLDQNLKFKNGKEIDNLKNKMTVYETAISDTTKKIETLKARQQELANTPGANPSKMQQTQLAIEKAERDLIKFNEELKTTQKQMATVNGRNFIDLGNKIKGVGKKLSTHLTLPIVGVVAGLGKLTHSTIEAGDEIAKTAFKLGISAESLQIFRYIADSSGTSIEAISKSFVRINKVVGDMSQGVSNVGTKAFEQLGISIKDSNGNIKSADKLFTEIQQSLNGMADVGQKNNIIYNLFGEKVGKELQTTLAVSKEEMAELTAQAQKLGIMSNETAAQSEVLDDRLTDMHQKATALKVSLAEELYPAFGAIVNFMTNSVIPTVQLIVDKFRGLSEEHKKLIMHIAMVVAAIGPAMMIFGQLTSMTGMVTNGFGMLRFALFGVSEGMNLATLGVGALIGIVGMALMQNEEFKELLMELTEVFVTLLKPIVKFAMILMDAIMPVLKIIIQLLQPVITLLVQVAKVVLDVLIPPFNIFIDVINAVIGTINLLLIGLKFLTFGKIDIQIPTLEKFDTSKSRKAAEEASNNVNNNTSNTYNNSFNISNGFDIKKAADALGMTQGKGVA